MKQLTKRILSLTFALMLFASIAGTASAENYETAGIYVRVGGTCMQNKSVPNILNTTTFVNENPDNAILATKLKFTNGIAYSQSAYAESSTGDTLFAQDFAIYVAIDLVPIGVYRTHEVKEGTQSDQGYAYYTYSDITLP